MDRAAERVQAALRVPGQEPLREGELHFGCGSRHGLSPPRRRLWGGCNMAEAAGPGPPSLPDRRPARYGPAALPGRPGAPCLSSKDWLPPPPPSKMAPFIQLRGFRASWSWHREGWCGSRDPVCQCWRRF